MLQGVILPAAFRIVLEKLASDPIADEDDPEDWRALWLRYLREAFSIDDVVAEMDSEEKQEWVRNALSRFSRMHDFIPKIQAMIGAREGREDVSSAFEIPQT